MFIFRRTKEPNTGFLVMNRLTPDNLIVYITENIEIEITGDFVIYKTADGKNSLSIFIYSINYLPFLFKLTNWIYYFINY